MGFNKSAAVSICILGAGLMAAGCSSNNASSSPTSAASPATSTPASTTATTAPAATTGTADCTVSVLGIALGVKKGTGQVTQTVDLTNKGATACTMEGFPGVNLVGMARGQHNYTWPLERSSTNYSQVTLQPGGTAHFDLTYLPFATGDGTDMTVTTIVITPPNTTTHTQLAWNQQVLLQDAATHSGTYIGPVNVGPE